MYKENVLLKIITYGPLLFVPFVVGMVLFLFINAYNESFKNNLQKIEQNLYNIEKKSVEKKAIDISNIISYKKSIIKDDLKSSVKNRVDSALLQAQNIYQQYKDTKSEKEIIEIIKNALRVLTWNNGESFIWILDYNGTFKLAPEYLRHLEGSSIINLQDANGRFVIQEEIEICKNKGSGFIWDTFTKPNDPSKKQYEQVAYVKAFGHYDLYFGSGEYLDTATKKTDKELTRAIKQIDSINNKENYIFLLNSKGDIFVNKSAPDIVGKNVSDIDNIATATVIKRIIAALKNRETANLEYEWLNLSTGKIETKHSHLRKVPNTDWIIGSGFFLSDIQNKLSQETVDMTKLFSKKSNNIIYLSILFMGLALLFSYYISRKLKQSFIKYEKNIHAKNNELIELNATLEDKVQKRTTELQQMKDDFEKLAKTDTLTQMHNRYSLMNILSAEVNRAHRYNTPLSLIIYDIDFFKKVNDTYGHDVGDEVLTSLSKKVKNALREIDIVGRYGGEEFLVILPNTNIDEAKLFAHRLRNEIEKSYFDKVGSVTISIGLVQLKSDETVDELFKRADELLYISKNNGRNQVSH